MRNAYLTYLKMNDQVRSWNMLLSGSEYAGTGEFGLSVVLFGRQKMSHRLRISPRRRAPDPAIARDAPLLPTPCCPGELSCAARRQQWSKFCSNNVISFPRWKMKKEFTASVTMFWDCCPHKLFKLYKYKVLETLDNIIIIRPCLTIHEAYNKCWTYKCPFISHRSKHNWII
jgi:hypothetical protein